MTGTPLTSTTNATGAYNLNNEPAGTYSIKVNVTGFAPYVKDMVVIAGGRALQLDLSLAIQQQQEQVTVAGDALTLDTPAHRAMPSQVVIHPAGGWMRFRMIPTSCRLTYSRWRVPAPDRMAGRCTSTASRPASFRRSLRSAKFASTRIPSPPNTTRSDSGGSRS